MEMIWAGVDRVVQVSDDEIAAAMRDIYECTHNIAEGAGAAAYAAAKQERSRINGKRVAAVLSGGNIDRALYAQVLASA
jgi:threonine dehydratase